MNVSNNMSSTITVATWLVPEKIAPQIVLSSRFFKTIWAMSLLLFVVMFGAWLAAKTLDAKRVARPIFDRPSVEIVPERVSVKYPPLARDYLPDSIANSESRPTK